MGSTRTSPRYSLSKTLTKLAGEVKQPQAAFLQAGPAAARDLPTGFGSGGLWRFCCAVYALAAPHKIPLSAAFV